jgi:hypothetical protein
MATENSKPQAPAPTRAPVIRLDNNGGDFTQRVLKRQVPAWVVSLGIHAVLLVVFLTFNAVFDKPPPAVVGSEAQDIVTKVEEEEKQENFENPDIGLDPSLPTNYKIDRIEDFSLAGPLKPDEPIGNNQGDGPPQTLPPPPGLGDSSGQGGALESAMAGLGSQGAALGMSGPPLQAGVGFRGRSGATRERMLREGGGNPATEASVARGLIWISKQQRPDGSWELPGEPRKIAGTGIALLPFLAAGYTHKGAPKESHNPNDKERKASKYPKQIDEGLKYLMSKQTRSGDFNSDNMYEHAIATMALCEAYGMTADKRLQPHAQSAVDYILKAQHPVGGWRYAPGQAGDTSVTGWQIQALKSAHLAGLKVPKDTLTRANSFLDSVAGGNPMGSTYGYVNRGASPSMTAVGLLCRQYLGWGPKNPGLIGGVEELKKMPPRDVRKPDDTRPMDVYYYYYATQVMHFYGGPDWHEFWNPRMRDWLLSLQVTGTGPNAGSWNPDGTFTGSAGGRLLTTCLCLLTEEVYYRHLPLYKRDAGGMKDLEGS